MVQDGYADRAVHAPAKARAARLAIRPDPDVNDVRTVSDITFAETFTAMLTRGMGRRHRRLLVFDTPRHAPEEMAAIIVAELLSGRPSGAIYGWPASVTGRAA